MDELFEIYVFEEIVGSIVLTALYLYLLVATFFKSKIIRTISAMLLICNLTAAVTYLTR
jgi:hypothetical protein